MRNRAAQVWVWEGPGRRNKANESGRKKNAFFMQAPRKRETVIKDILKTVPQVDYHFYPCKINWCPDNKPIQVYTRSFLEALNSLLTNTELVREENYSFPNPDSPFIEPDFEMDDDKIISELHHGEWWINSWKLICSKSNEIIIGKNLLK